jgi:NADPH-dependent 2,4-dienoyl-CoA reductase/sulfur reductase-like enzyme
VGVRTTIIEMADQVLPQALGPDMAGIVEAHLKENNIKVMLSQRVEQIHGDTITGVTSVETQETTIECHMVVSVCRGAAKYRIRCGRRTGC